MTNQTNSLETWLQSRYKGVRSNHGYLIDDLAIQNLVTLVVEETEGTATQISEDVAQLIRICLLDQQDQTRGVIGNLAVVQSPSNVAGVILSIVSILAAAMEPGAVSFGLSFASAIQNACAMFQKLSPEERRIVLLLRANDRLNPESTMTAEDLALETGLPRPALATVAATLARLRDLTVIEWSGELDSPIALRELW